MAHSYDSPVSPLSLRRVPLLDFFFSPSSFKGFCTQFFPVGFFSSFSNDAHRPPHWECRLSWFSLRSFFHLPWTIYFPFCVRGVSSLVLQSTYTPLTHPPNGPIGEHRCLCVISKPPPPLTSLSVTILDQLFFIN